jgi:predicted dienelactone hydrolase
MRANAQRLAQFDRRVTLTLLPDAGHYTFLAACADAGHRAQPQLCTDAAGVDREEVHARTIDLAAQFFDRSLE